MEQMITDDPQQFFKHVNLSRKQSEDLPTSMSFESKVAENSADIVDLFRQFFQSVYSVPSNECIQRFNDFYDVNDHIIKLKNVCQNVAPITFEETDIIQCINDLPDNMVMGPDNIPNRFIKRCASSISQPIFHLLSKSFEQAVIPSIWKRLYIRPIHNSGKKSDAANVM